MTPKCDICGREMVLWVDHQHGTPSMWICNSTPDQHKIAELERALTQSRTDAHAMRDQKDRDMDLVTSRLESKLREAQERELVLREALGFSLGVIKGVKEAIPSFELDDPADDASLNRAMDAFMDTSATAQQIVERIKREALEVVLPMAKLGLHGFTNRWVGLGQLAEDAGLIFPEFEGVSSWRETPKAQKARAAILGEKNP